MTTFSTEKVSHFPKATQLLKGQWRNLKGGMARVSGDLISMEYEDGLVMQT